MEINNHIESTVVIVASLVRKENDQIFVWYLADSREVKMAMDDLGVGVQVNIPVPITRSGMIHIPKDTSLTMVGGIILSMN